MSFNIRYGSAEDGENRWERRKSFVIDRIMAFDPDLLGLQECQDDSQADFIKANLTEYEFLGVPRGGDSKTSLEMAPVLIKRASFQLMQWETFWLSETPHIPGSKSWGGVFPRTVTWVDLFHPASGRSLSFVNTHFDYEASAIQESARFLKKWIHDSIAQRPLLITGDFNADKNSVAHRQLTSGDLLLRDVFSPGAAHESEGTFHGYGTEAHPQPIDWILVSDHFEIMTAGADRYQEGNLFTSDHYPVMAVLDWTTPS